MIWDTEVLLPMELNQTSKIQTVKIKSLLFDFWKNCFMIFLKVNVIDARVGNCKLIFKNVLKLSQPIFSKKINTNKQA